MAKGCHQQQADSIFIRSDIVGIIHSKGFPERLKIRNADAAKARRDRQQRYRQHSWFHRLHTDSQVLRQHPEEEHHFLLPYKYSEISVMTGSQLQHTY